MRHLLKGAFFAYHHAMTHLHLIIILSLFSIPLVLKCAANILKICLQIKTLRPKMFLSRDCLHGEIVTKGSHYFPGKNYKL